MFKLASYLTVSRYNVYYFRFVLPAYASLDGKAHDFSISLQTRSLSEATTLSKIISVANSQLIQRLKKVDYIELKNGLKTYVAAKKQAIMDELNREGPLSPTWRKITKENIEANELMLDDATKGKPIGWFSDEELIEAKKILSDQGIKITSKEDEKRLLVELYRIDGQMEQFKLEYSDQLSSHTPPVYTSAPQRNASHSTTNITLNELITKYCDDMVQSNHWTSKTENENRAIFKILADLLGEKSPTSSIHADAVSELKAIILKLPPNLTKNRTRTNKSLQNIAKENAGKKLSSRTIEKYFTRFTSLFAYAVERDYVKSNPFKVVAKSLPKVKKSGDRQALDKSDLEKLFSSKNFNADNIRKHYQYWVPLLALHTGARLNEICQLGVNDLQETAPNCYSIQITDGGEGQRLKNDASRRLVPLHSQLIALGFIDFVNYQKSRSKIFIFENELRNHASNGWGHKASRWFNETYKRRCAINGKDKVFHSFRHTVTTEFKRLGVPEQYTKQILGHSEDSITYGHYGKSIDIETLRETVEKLNFDFCLAGIKPFTQHFNIQRSTAD